MPFNPVELYFICEPNVIKIIKSESHKNKHVSDSFIENQKKKKRRLRSSTGTIPEEGAEAPVVQSSHSYL